MSKNIKRFSIGGINLPDNKELNSNLKIEELPYLILFICQLNNILVNQEKSLLKKVIMLKEDN